MISTHFFDWYTLLRVWRVALFVSLALAFQASSVRAVTIYTADPSDDGSGNVSAPADDPGWVNVGVRAGSTSAVYLGDRWVLTASHVGAGTVTLDGVDHLQAQPSVVYPVFNADGTRPDLILFRLADLPPLPPLPITSSAVQSSGNVTEVVMIGHGRDRAASKTYWDANWQETTNLFLAQYSGYKTVTNRTTRWGTNQVSATDSSATLTCYPATHPSGTSCGPTYMFLLRFDDGNPTAFEARANGGDSGGGVFRKTTGGVWELAGIMLAVNAYVGQPSTTYTVFGTSTFVADLDHYRDSIQAVIDANPDSDGDGILDADDLCPGIDNASNNIDTDGDGIGDFCQCGDVDANGSLSNADATWIKRYLQGYSVPPSFSPALCDVDASGSCSNADATWIKRYLQGYSVPPSFTLICAPTSPAL